jgi:hypothetical protein
LASFKELAAGGVTMFGRGARDVSARAPVAIEDKQLHAVTRVLPYTTIDGAVYSFSKHPRWKGGVATAAAVGIFAAPIFFMKGTKHWLTLHAGNDFTVLHLDKKNYLTIVPAFEKHTGLKVESRTDEK